MNTPRIPTPFPTPRQIPVSTASLVPAPIRHLHRERDFGVGYGNSSGYASTRNYAVNSLQPRFRCA